jgi:hypothetical protein
MEGSMFRQLVICGVFLAVGTMTTAAQQPNVILRKVQVLGADYDIVFAMSQPVVPAPTDLFDKGDSLTIHEIGEELAYAVKGEIEATFKEVGPPLMPIYAFRLEMRGVKSSNALNVYVVPKIGPPIQ